MKKVVAIALSLMLLLSSVAAFASEAPFEGTWVTFEDGFEIMLPSDWQELEVTDELLSAGIFYAAMSPDAARHMQIAWAETTATSIEEIEAGLATTYTEVQTLTINDINFVSYTDATNDSTGIVALDAEAGGMYIFNFTPASDAEFGPIAVAIATSIRNVQE